MKKIGCCCIVPLIVLVVIFIGGYIFLKNAGIIDKLDNSQFTLVKEQGTVSYKGVFDLFYQPITSEESDFRQGTFIKTDANSAAQIILPDNSIISLDQNTEIQVNIASNNVNIQQLVGKTWNRVETVTQGGSFKIQTPTTLASVRGTIFGVEYTPSGENSDSQVYVQESNVDVSKIENGIAKESESVRVAPEENILIRKSKGEINVNKDRIPDQIRNSNWFKKNKLVDSIYLQIKQERITDIKGEFKKRYAQQKLEILKYNSLTSSSGTNANSLLPNFSSTYDLNGDTTMICSRINSSQINESIGFLRLYGANTEPIVNFLTTFSRDCAKGYLTDSDLNQLRSLSDQINGK